jgi:hypothetical protein
MTKLPEQPTVEEVVKFPQAPAPVVLVDDNTEGVAKDKLAKVSGKDVDPNGKGKV